MPFALTAQAAVNVNFAANDTSMKDAIQGETSANYTFDDLTISFETSDNWRSSTGMNFIASDGLVVMAQNNNSLTLSFDKDVEISSLVTKALLVMSGDEEVRMSWGSSGSLIEKNYSDSEQRTSTFSQPIQLAAGEALTFTSINPDYPHGGNVIFLRELNLTVVPEPAVYGLGLGLLTLGVVVLRRRRARCG